MNSIVVLIDIATSSVRDIGGSKNLTIVFQVFRFIL